MESLNVYKLGYGQLNQLELDDHNIPVHKLTSLHLQDDTTTTANNLRRRPIVVISLTLLLTLIVASLLAALIYHSETEDEDSELSSNILSESIKAVCSVTQHPDSCFTDISSCSINPESKPDPVFIFSLSLEVAITRISNLSSLPKTLIPRVNDPQIVSALRDCQDLFSDAFDRLNQSKSAVLLVGEDGKKRESFLDDESKMNDLKTWISAAMTDEQTCLDGLEETGSSTMVVDQVKAAVQKSSVSLSNNLAILANMKTLFDKFDKLFD
ncbi:hypothetical protein Ancab_035891 [Ancistrocladus abbreviatus]